MKYIVLLLIGTALIAGCVQTNQAGNQTGATQRNDFGCWPPSCSYIPDTYGKQLCEDWKAGKQVTWYDCSAMAAFPNCVKLCEFEKQANPQTNATAGVGNYPSSSPSGPQIDCSMFASIPDCSFVGQPGSQNYELCKQCLPNKTDSSIPYKDPNPDNVDIYIGDFKHHRIIRIEDMVGTGWTAFGSQGTDTGQFELPEHLTVDEIGRIYVPNADNGDIVRMDDMTGKGWISFAGFGIGNTLRDQQPGPFVIRVRGGYIYSAGLGHIYRMDDMTGKNLVTYGQFGNGGVGRFNNPQYLSFDAQGRFYVGDDRNNRIVRIDDMTGKGWTEFGSLGTGVGKFNTTACVTVDQQGRIYVCDEHNDRIVRMDDMTGAGWTTFSTTGATEQALKLPHDIAVSPSGRIYIADTGNARIVRIDDMTGKGWIAYGPYANAQPGADPHQMEAPKGIFIAEKK